MNGISGVREVEFHLVYFFQNKIFQLTNVYVCVCVGVFIFILSSLQFIYDLAKIKINICLYYG